MAYAKSPKDLISQDELLGMSGLEFMQGILAGTLPAPPIAKTLGFLLHHIEPGTAVFRGAPQFDVTNPMGTVHGGWYGAVLDSALGCAVMTHVPKGSVYTTMEYKVNIVRSIPLGMQVEASASTSHMGRSSGIANGEIRGVEDGKLYATGSTTCIVMKMT